MNHVGAIIRPIASIENQEVERARGATMRVLLGQDDGVANFYTRQFSLAPGGRIPAHRHRNIEHQQLMLAGELTLTLDGEQRRARAGDCLYIPAGITHAYENLGDQEARFVCIVPAVHPYETEWLE